MPFTFNPFLGNFDRYSKPPLPCGAIDPFIYFSDTVYAVALSSENKLVSVDVLSPTECIVLLRTDSFANFKEGAQVHFTRRDTGIVQFSAEAGVNLRSADNRSYIRTRDSTASVLKLSANEWILFGDISTKTYTVTS